MKSYWVETTKQTNYPKLQKDETTDVCIIGGGITGIATAYMLARNRPYPKKLSLNQKPPALLNQKIQKPPALMKLT